MFYIYATGSFLEVIGDLMTVGKATISRVVNEVTDTLHRMGGFITMPKNDNDIRCTMSDFYQIAQVPGVVGCVAGTHIYIQAPCDDQESHFVYHKGYHSINVQMICNARKCVANVVAD